MKKILAVLLATVMTLLTFSACIIPVSAEESDTIYFIDFEDYETSLNWVDFVDSNDFVTGLGDGKENLWTIYGSKNLVTTTDEGKKSNAEVRVVSNSSIREGKILKISANGMEAGQGDNWFHVKLNADKSKGAIKRSDMRPGKKLVLSADLYLPTARKSYEAPFMRYMGAYKNSGFHQGSLSTGLNIHADSRIYAIMNSTHWEHYGFARHAKSIGNKWVTIKNIIDVSEPLSASHPADTARFIHDGALMVTKVGNEGDGTRIAINPKFKYEVGTTIVDTWQNAFKGDDLLSSVPDFYGVVFGNSQATTTAGKSSTTEYYIDNVKAYWIDVFVQEGEIKYGRTNEDGSWYNGAIEIPFNREIAENVKVDGVKTATYTLKDLVTLTDESGNKVENGFESVTLSKDKKTLLATPSDALEKGKTYKINLDCRFSDTEGQGLWVSGDATETKEIASFVVGEDVPFELAEISKDTVSYFSQGVQTEIKAKFTYSIYDESIENGIVVTNAKTGEIVDRSEGWSASFDQKNGNTDNKTIIFDFTNLPTASYVVTVNDEFIAKNGKNLSSEFKIVINDTPNSKVVLFDEDFDTDYELNENWITNSNVGSADLKSSGKTYYTTADGNWDIEIYGTANDGDFVGVVKAPPTEQPGGFSGNVLKVSNTRATSYNTYWTALRRNFNGKKGISLTSGEYEGKTLVYEADVYVPFIKWETSFMMPSRHRAYIREYEVAGQFSGMLLTSGSFRMTHGTYANSSYGARYMWHVAPSTADKFTDIPKKLVIAIDQTSEVDTARVYFNGKQLTGAYPSDVLEGHPTSGLKLKDFQGAAYKGQETNLADTLYGVWSLATQNTLYIDNFKAYLVDTFEIESVEGVTDEFNVEKNRIVYTFNKPVDPATVDGNVALLDETGLEIGGAIESAVLSENNTKLTVKLSDTLLGLTKYTVYIKDRLKDIDGLEISTRYSYYNTYDMDEHYTQNADGTYDVMVGKTPHNLTYKERTETTPATLTITQGNKHQSPIDCYLPDEYVMKTKVDVVTTKATSLFATAKPAVLSGNSATAEVYFTNPEEYDVKVWAMLVAYDEKNTMLGCTTISKTVDAMSQTDAKNYTVNADGGEIKSVVLYVWNNFVDMNPYHGAETLFSK